MHRLLHELNTLETLRTRAVPRFKSDPVVLWDRTHKKDTGVGIIDEVKSIIETPERAIEMFAYFKCSYI
ncbi:hypothetical protein E2P60_00275 [Candidatus Bathyarchaeota archaeon]|nr:hypothetical protein E2P60_00275 [Candidatus Bathyarchaeota archaeon]